MTDTALDLDSVRDQVAYASSGIDGPDMPYHPHALAAMRAAEKLLAEVERSRPVVDAAQKATETDGVDEWNLLVAAVERYESEQS